MSLDRIDDVEVLRDLVRAQLRESERLKKELAEAYAKLKDKKPAEAEQLALKLAQIERQHAAALQQLFGQKSERRPSDKPSKPRAPQSGHGPRSQPQLPMLEEIHVASDEEPLACDVCSKPLTAWKDEFEDSEEIDFVAPQVVLKKIRRQKYRCSCGGCVKTAQGPEKLFPGARYSINFALHVATQKYTNHLPLDRQRRDFRRMGLEVTTATLWDYVSALYTKLSPVMTRLHKHVLSQPVMGMDETTWRLLKSEQKGRSKKWWVWAQRVDNAVHYTLDASRGADIAKELLRGYQGVVIADGYQVYDSVQRTNPGIRLANCWAHARREVLPFEAEPRGARVLRVIQRMYRLEAIARERGLSPPELLQWRQRKTRPLLQALFRWLANLAIPSTYDLHGALSYILKREAGLTVFLGDPLVSADNNATERVIRGIVVGRKNHYGSRSERGTQVAALFYSLVDSAELAGVSPQQYLQAAVRAALDDKEIPLPHEFVESRSDANAS